MWTPKRIMLLAAGFLLFTLVYLLYSTTSLGRINTLPPLPEKYQPGEGGEEPIVARAARVNSLERKLEQAFRKPCEETGWPVQLELNAKSMVVAAKDCKPEPDGRVKLVTMSLALFGKPKNDGRDIEINTLKCDEAYLTFDQPVTSLTPSELSGRKIVKAELWGNAGQPIFITNNRRSAAAFDDLIVVIHRGPLHYEEKSQTVWTSDDIHLRDGQLKPPKADIHAKGMEMELASAAPPPKPGMAAAHKAKNDSISGVKRIVLKQDVSMDLYTAGATPFPGGDKTRPAASVKPASGGRQPPVRAQQGADAPRSPAAPHAEELTHIRIRTPGRFQYDIFKDHDMARFDVPEDADHANSPQDVTVQRFNERADDDRLASKQYDQLVCKHLELRIKRRDGEAAPPAAAAQSMEQGLEIETAHATGPDVTLTSDAEKLDAHGNDFFHDAAKKLTILKGVPFMEANKDESIIEAPELRMQDIPLPTPPGSPPKMYQKVIASGPGRIHLPKKVGDKTVHTSHAVWNDKLTSTRDGELDLLILTGAAHFKDDDNDQLLKAETLKVWLLPDDKKPQPAAMAKAAPPAKVNPPAKPPGAPQLPGGPQQGRRPHHVEALRNVLAHSPQLHIHDASRLVIRFLDVPASKMPPPSNAKPGAKPADNKVGSASGTPAPRSAGVPPAQQPAANKAPPAPDEKPPPPRPVDLTASWIEAEVLRCQERLALDHLWAQGANSDTEGGVRVIQAPADPKEKGIDIKGNTLDMKCHPEGNMLIVTGDLAQLLMDKILILGPEVNIDQAANKSWVNGKGAMRIESNQTLDGKQLKQAMPLTVHWEQNMFFDGDFAEFHGGIQAEQDNARLACQRLQVFFDQPISLKEGVRGDRPAKVRNLVGDKEVRVEDKVVVQIKTRVEDKIVVQNQLQKYQLLLGTTITMNSVPRDDVLTPSPPKKDDKNGQAKSNDANEVRLSGPGSVRMLQRGGADPAALPGNTAANKPTSPESANDQQMKMTYVTFRELMKASNKTNTADFWGGVRVLNFPCENEHQDFDLDDMAADPPVGAMYLSCNRLKVASKSDPVDKSKKDAAAKSHQEMEAHGQVWVRTRELTAQADRMDYNEAKDQIIFTGEANNLAVLTKFRYPGAPPDVIRARKIYYKRSTGEATIDGGGSLQGGPVQGN